MCKLLRCCYCICEIDQLFKPFKKAETNNSSLTHHKSIARELNKVKTVHKISRYMLNNQLFQARFYNTSKCSVKHDDYRTY